MCADSQDLAVLSWLLCYHSYHKGTVEHTHTHVYMYVSQHDWLYNSCSDSRTYIHTHTHTHTHTYTRIHTHTHTHTHTYISSLVGLVCEHLTSKTSELEKNHFLLFFHFSSLSCAICSPVDPRVICDPSSPHRYYGTPLSTAINGCW